MLPPGPERDTPAPLVAESPLASAAAGVGIAALGILFLVGYSLLGLAAPIPAGEAGARLSTYAARALTSGEVRPFAALIAATYRAADETPVGLRLPALILSALTACALARVAWRGWGPIGAGAAVVLFALMPRLAAFSSVPDAEMAALFAVLMAIGSYLRYRALQRASAAAATVVWVAVAGIFGAMGLAVGAWLAGRAAIVGLRRTRTAGGRRIDAPLTGRSPLAAVMTRRQGKWLYSFAAVLAIVVMVEAALWVVVSVRSAPVASPERILWPVLPIAVPIFLLIWTAVFAASALRRGVAARESVILALIVATAPLFFAGLRPGGVRSTWLTPAAVLLPLIAVDLSAALGAFVARRLPARLAGGAAAAVVLGAVAAVLLPSFGAHLLASRRVGGLAGTASTVRPGLADGRLLLERTLALLQPGDRVLVREGFPIDARPGESLERVPTLTAALGQKGQASRSVLLFQQPLARDELVALKRLLRVHPAVRLCAATGCTNSALWFVDLRGSAPGIESYAIHRALVPPSGSAWRRLLLYPGAERVEIERQPWEEAVLDAAFSISPVPGRLPALTFPEDGARDRLLVFHNVAIASGDREGARRARALLVAGSTAPLAFQDPTPLGRVIAARWSAAERSLVLLWECPFTPPRAADFALRFIIQTGKRREAVEHTSTSGCAEAASGELREEKIELAPPSRRGWTVSLEHTRPGRRQRRVATGNTVPLIAVE